jgi:hypothetical protein
MAAIYRKTHPALVAGLLEPLDAPEPLLAFRRIAKNERLLVIINFGDRAVDLPAALTARARPLSGHGFAYIERGGGLALPRYGMLFAEIV